MVRKTNKTLRLNYDVLLIVLRAASSKAGLARMMRTCRTFYQTGIPFLLEGKIAITGSRGLASFCEFMLADGERFHYLRSLKVRLAAGSQDEQLMEEFACVLRHSHALQDLHIVAPNARDEYGCISDAIVDMTALRALSVHEGFFNRSKPLSDVLQLSKSPIQDLEVAFDALRHPLYDPHPLDMLSGVSERLEILRVSNADIAAYDGFLFTRLKMLVSSAHSTLR